jgi:predicted HAD superfamily hydrolase
MTVNFIDYPFDARAGNEAMIERPASERYLQIAADYDVISFDVFETLLHRQGVFRPVDLFLVIGAEAKELTGLGPEDFANLRVRAEREARCAMAIRGGEEVRIEEIYSSFNRLLVTSGRLPVPEIERLIELELETELAHLKPIEAVRPFYDWAIQTGKTVVLVSDFYAPQGFLDEALRRNGYGDHHGLFVSSTLDLTKHHGGLYGHVCEALGADPSDVLHVGDNPWSDGSRALQAGIAHLRIANPANRLIQRQQIDWRRPSPRLTSAMHTASVSSLYGQGLNFLEPSDMPVPERVGRECLGPLLLGMASWLYEEAADEGFTDFFFCSRDGLVMKQAFDLYQQHFGVRADTHYLEVSRQVIYRALAASDPKSAEALFVQNWSRLTPADALARWGLDPAAHAEAIKAAGFQSAYDAVAIGNAAGAKRFRTLFQACRQALGDANTAHADMFASYLVGSGLTGAKAPCLVDIGWHGSLQAGLDTVLASIGSKASLAGRYIGLFLNDERLKGFAAAGYLFSKDGTPLAKALRASPSLVELLHTAGHGSTAGYIHRKGETVAVFENRPDEITQYQTMIEPIQQAALVFVSDVLSNPGLTAHTIAPADAFAGLNRLLNRPDRDEYETIGALRIAANYGAAATDTALTDVSDEGYRLWNSGSRKI